MLKLKIKLPWLLTATLITTLLISTGFIYYNWQLYQNFDQVSIPIKGLNLGAPEFAYNIEGEKDKEHLVNPLSVAVSGNKVYVTDSENHRINVYTKKGKYLFSFGQYGVKDGEFIYPNTIAIDSQERVYVGEFQTGRIQVFKAHGKFIKSIVRNKDRDIVPLSIEVNKEMIYVVNKTGEIVVLDQDGNLLDKFGQAGTGEGQLSFPNGIAIAKDGRVFVSDSGNSRVQVFSAKGEFIEVLDTKQYRLNMPRGLAFDEFGYLYVVDIFAHNVSVYDQHLNYLYSFGDRGVGPESFNFPNDIDIDNEFRIFVTDRENNRLGVFSY